MLIDHIMDNLKIDKNFIEKYKNTNLNNIKNFEEREKIMIYRNYYDFINFEESINIIESFYKTFSEDENQNVPTEYKWILSIIIFKSFTEKYKFTSNCIGYVSSDDIANYVDEEFKKYLIFNNIYIKWKKRGTMIIGAIDILNHSKLIKSKIIKYQGLSYKTYKYYKIDIKDYIKKTDFDYSYLEFKWVDFEDISYVKSIHYSKLYKINKKNIKSNKFFNIKDKKYILDKINIGLYVDKEYQKDLISLLKNEKELKEHLKQQTDLLKLHYEKDLWTISTKQEVSEIQKNISKTTNELLQIEFARYDFGEDPIRFPIYLDFRGRKYYYSPVAPTTSRILRLSYYYGYYGNEVKKEIKYSYGYEEEIEKFCFNNKIKYDINIQEHIFWCLIGIGKFFINKDRFPINLEEFIQKGIENFKDDIIDIEIDKQLEIRHYCRIIKSLNEEKVKKRTIIKDATASINQIFMKKLGPIDQNSLNYVNLGKENKWYDTYIVHREKFKENYSKIIRINSEEFNKYFDRKLIKNTIMIIPYSAGFDLCWENYIKQIEERKLNLIINKEFKKLYELFYNFIKNEIQEKYFYIKSSEKMISDINKTFEEERKYILESETGSADISYYKTKKGSLDKKYKYKNEERRITRLILETTTAIDIENFNIASGANTIHFYDAEEIRNLEKELKYNIITVHDSYLIDFANCSKLIEIKLNHYKKYIKNYEISNIFILL